MRGETHFANHLNHITPVQSRAQKYSSFVFPNHAYFHVVPSRSEGRFAVVTNVEAGCGGREFAAAGVMLADERQACGREDAWSWRPEAGVKLATMLTHRADDGG
ncbi:hypothetical protein ACQR1K_04595 [Bradyrhizobium sp. HKCCYLRH3095]